MIDVNVNYGVDMAFDLFCYLEIYFREEMCIKMILP